MDSSVSQLSSLPDVAGGEKMVVVLGMAVCEMRDSEMEGKINKKSVAATEENIQLNGRRLKAPCFAKS